MSLVMQEITFFGGSTACFYLVIRIWGSCINYLTTPLNLSMKIFGRYSNQVLLCKKALSPTDSQCHTTNKHLFSLHVLGVSSELASGGWAQLRHCCYVPGVLTLFLEPAGWPKLILLQVMTQVQTASRSLFRPGFRTGIQLFLPHFIDQNKSHG